MKFDLDNLNPGTRFDFPDSDAWVCLRTCAGDDLKAIHKQTRKKKIEYRRGQRFEYQEINEGLESRLLWDFCIMDWGGLFDKHAKPIACNTEMKVLLMGKSVVFSSFVVECLDKLNQAEARDEEKREKNSSSSQNGSKKSQAARAAE